MNKLIILLAPSKTMDFSVMTPGWVDQTKPLFMPEAEQLVERSLAIQDFNKAFGVSDKLGQKTRAELELWGSGPKKQAFWAYTGDVYRGLGIDSLSQEEQPAIRHKLRVISGLYGYVRPTDMIERYRLEMKTKISGSPEPNLYRYWGDKIARAMIEDLDAGGLVVNATSVEYSSSVLKYLPESIRVITPKFLQQYPDGRTKDITVYTKVARGELARYAVVNDVCNDSDLMGFNLSGYKYSPGISTPDCPVFVRAAPPKPK